MWDRVIKTGLKNEIDMEVLDSVMGQMSDGIWENSRGIEKYWYFADLDWDDFGEIVIRVPGGPWAYCRWQGEMKKNPYAGMTDDGIRRYFANKAKAVVQEEVKDTNRGWQQHEEGFAWKRGCEEVLQYMGGHGIDEVKVSDVFRVYDVLIGRTATC